MNRSELDVSDPKALHHPSDRGRGRRREYHAPVRFVS